ncbi:hypothetical protein B9Z55_026456 [Caenorhabditis nigoni]|uniref:PH domain-containing protein n=1 Tax=Caenorhabditis nigoni TaxID=1611254 RepID=A0A2G5T3I6_9PELO|nr:hypothetical protein B9Z55_026456 [Caenorhabditis nigoni]
MWGRKPIDVEDSFDYWSDEESSSPSTARPSNSQANREVREMLARWNAQELDRITASNVKLDKTASSIPGIPSEDKVKEDKEERTPPPPARSTCDPSTSSAEPLQTDRKSFSSTSQQFRKNVELELEKFFIKLRSYHRFLVIVIEKLKTLLEKKLPKKERKKIEQLVKALKGVRSVFEICDSCRTKDRAELVIKFSSFVKSCLHAMSIAENVTREVEKSKDENEKLKNAFLEFECQYFTNDNPSNIQSKFCAMRKDLERCGPILGKVVETIDGENEKKQLAQEAVQKLENVGRPNSDQQKDLQLRKKAILHKMFQGKLNVYEPARYFLKEGPVRKQSRHKWQARHLVLFSDVFCVCRLQTPIKSFWKKNKSSNVKKCYILDINEIQINPDTPEDGKVLEIWSSVKSFSFHFESKEEKTAWEKAIRETQEQASGRIGHKNLEQPTDSKWLKPIRLPVADVTECMIERCKSSFSLLSECERKSCKNCGIAICCRCVGSAPLVKMNYKKGNVCLDCYDKILEECYAGTLFPVTYFTKGKLWVQVGKKLRKASSLFNKPQNAGLKKKDFEERETDKIAADYVYIKDANGKEKLRFVYIRQSDHTLRVFKSKYDSTIIGEAESLEWFKIEVKTDGWHFQLKRKDKLRTMEIRIENPDIATDWEMSLGPIFKRKYF